MRRTVLFVVLVLSASLVAASCSGSPTATKDKEKQHASRHLAAPTTAPATSGRSGTGAGTTTSSTPGAATSTTGSTSSTTGSASGVTTTTSPFVINPKTGKVQRKVGGPAISKFKPASSPVGGTVVIVGKRLGHALAVAFDGLPATITSNSGTKIYAVVPAGATSGPISVVTVSGSVTVAGFVVS